jgi:hypothetical protein
VSYEFFPYILVAYTTALFSIARESSGSPSKSASARQAAEEKKLYLGPPESELSFPIL